MKAKVIFLVVSLSFVLFETSFAQLPPPPRAIVRPSIKTLSVQRPFVSLDANYSIALPEPVFTNNWIFQEGQIGINFAKGGIAGSAQELAAITERYDETLLSKLAGKITDEKFYESNGLPASLAYFAFNDGSFGVRKFVLAKTTVYIMFALFKDSAGAAFFADIFDTFKIVGKAEIDAEIQRKFEAATPPDLPQTPVLKNQPSDKPLADRKYSYAYEFDRRGNWIKKRLQKK